jgi:alpha-L-fucosidase
MRDNEKIQESSQQVDDGEFAKRVGSQDEDLGSRAVLEKAEDAVWYPAEVNTSIRPGWFYHATEDDSVKTAEELMELFERTVGGNSTFLLNLPPDKRGLLHENDVSRMKELGERIRATYGTNLAAGAEVRGPRAKDEAHEADRITDGDPMTYWQSPEGEEQAEFVVDLGTKHRFDRVTLAEHIREGQRVERFRLEADNGDGVWTFLYEGTVIGYKKICRLEAATARRLRLTIVESRWSPTLSGFGVYLSR